MTIDRDSNYYLICILLTIFSSCSLHVSFLENLEYYSCTSLSWLRVQLKSIEILGQILDKIQKFRNLEDDVILNKDKSKGKVEAGLDVSSITVFRQLGAMVKRRKERSNI